MCESLSNNSIRIAQSRLQERLRAKGVSYGEEIGDTFRYRLPSYGKKNSTRSEFDVRVYVGSMDFLSVLNAVGHVRSH